MTLSEIRTNINTLLTGLFDPVPVIWADQNEGKAANNVVYTRLSPLSQIHRSEIRQPNDDGESVIRTHFEFNLTISYFGPDSMDAVFTFYQELEAQSIHDLLRTMGLVVVSKEPILDLSRQQHSLIEPRAVCTLLFRVASEIVDTGIDIIEIVEGTGKLIRDDSTIIIEEVVIIPEE